MRTYSSTKMSTRNSSKNSELVVREVHEKSLSALTETQVLCDEVY